MPAFNRFEQGRFMTLQSISSTASKAGSLYSFGRPGRFFVLLYEGAFKTLIAYFQLYPHTSQNSSSIFLFVSLSAARYRFRIDPLYSFFDFLLIIMALFMGYINYDATTFFKKSLGYINFESMRYKLFP